MLIATGVLYRALKTLVHLVPRHPTLPILESVLFEPVENGVAIIATDLTTEARVVVPATSALSICLPARDLLEFVTSLGRDTTIAMTTHGELANVTAEGSDLELARRPTSDFPARSKHVGKATALQDPEGFLGALSWVSRALSSDETRPQLTGVYFDGDNQTIVATDGHRLHAATVRGLACARALAPSRAVAFMLRALRNGPIAISVDDKTVRLASSTWTITTRQLDAKFPPYEQVIPSGSAFTLKVQTTELEAGLKRVARRGTSRDVKPIRIRANGAIKIESGVPEVQLSTVVKVFDSTHEGDELVIGFNGRYVAEAIEDLDQTATIRFLGAEEPVTVQMEDRIAVVMPLRLS